MSTCHPPPGIPGGGEAKKKDVVGGGLFFFTSSTYHEGERQALSRAYRLREESGGSSGQRRTIERYGKGEKARSATQREESSTASYINRATAAEVLRRRSTVTMGDALAHMHSPAARPRILRALPSQLTASRVSDATVVAAAPSSVANHQLLAEMNDPSSVAALDEYLAHVEKLAEPRQGASANTAGYGSV